MTRPAPTAAEIIAAYESTGLRPARFKINPYRGDCTDGQCCAIGALATQAGRTHDERGDFYIWADETYGEEMAGYVIAGFDESGIATPKQYDASPEELAAYAAARLAGRTLLGFEPFDG